jgi:Fe-S-cluster-containing dehydrogenase component
MPIRFDPTRCSSCRTCVYVCSAHHTGVFWPEMSSIQVARDYRTGDISWSLGPGCDGCRNEDEPWCVKYCTYEALSVRSVP